METNEPRKSSTKKNRVKIHGSRALVTGASGGLGQAIARKLAARGASVVITGRQKEVLNELAATINARVVVADLSKNDGIARLVEEAGPIDILVANAGIPASGSLIDTTADQVERAIDVNLRSPMQLARVFARQMADRHAGQIVFISSISGKVSMPSTAVYSATKFALRGLAIGLRADIASRGVGVSIVCPGFIREAGMFAKSGVKVPLGTGTRTPQDVAEGVARCIDRDLAEIDVAAPLQRLGGLLALIAPSTISKFGRLPMAARFAGELTDVQSGMW